MTRIIGGRIGSLRLKGPAKPTRPTSDRVKESVFSILESMNAITGATVVDLFAGTGALGLEAASRGAKKVTFVERDRSAASVCQENIRRVEVGLTSAAIDCELGLETKSAQKYLSGEVNADLMFVDPPYEQTSKDLLELLSTANLNPGCLIVLERSGREARTEFPENFELIKQTSYGDTVVFFLTTVGAR